MRSAARLGFTAAALASMSLCSAGCGYSLHRSAAAHTTVVRVSVTPSGCKPEPGQVAAGEIEFVVTNLDAPTVSEVEVRTSDLSQVLGERENLIEGLSASFTVRLSSGRYVLSCPGAAQQQWPLSISAALRQ